MLERALVRVSIGCAQRRSQEWRFFFSFFFFSCYNQLMLRPWTRRLQGTTDGLWIPLHRRSGCGILPTSVQTLGKSPIWSCHDCEARASLPRRSTWYFSVSAHYIQGQDAVCFRERAFSPHTADRSHQEVKEVRSLFFFVSFRANWCVIAGFRGLIADLVVQHCREHGSVNWAWV